MIAGAQDSTTAKNIYTKILDVRQQVAELFSCEPTKDPYLLFVPEKAYGAEFIQNLQWYPQDIPEDITSLQGMLTFMNPVSHFNPKDNLIILMHPFEEKALVEIATYSSLQLNNTDDKTNLMQPLELPTSLLNYLHKDLEKTYNKNKPRDREKNLTVVIENFFHPLVSQYLFETNGVFDPALITPNLNKIKRNNLNKTKRQRLLTNYIIEVAKYSPSFAARTLLAQYNNDVKALVAEHPALAQHSSQELWKNYCVPLLKNGKL